MQMEAKSGEWSLRWSKWELSMHRQGKKMPSGLCSRWDWNDLHVQNWLMQIPGLGQPAGNGSLKFCVVRKLRGTILSTYKIPCKWSHSCCKIRAFHPLAVTVIGWPSRPSPLTSTSKHRSTSARYPSTLRQPSKKNALPLLAFLVSFGLIITYTPNKPPNNQHFATHPNYVNSKHLHTLGW